MQAFKLRWKAMVVIFIMIIGITVLITFLQPFEYKASARFLVVPVQEQSFDAFEAAKAAERFGETLSQIVYTSAFSEMVLSSDIDTFDHSRFSTNETAKRKEWTQKIQTQVARETGMITVDVFDENSTQAEGILQAISFFVTTQSEQYHGAGKNIRVEVVDSPLTSEKPVRPNVFLNIFISFVASIFASIAYVLLRSTWKLAPQQLLKKSESSTTVQPAYSFAQGFEEIADLESDGGSVAVPMMPQVSPAAVAYHQPMTSSESVMTQTTETPTPVYAASPVPSASLTYQPRPLSQNETSMIDDLQPMEQGAYSNNVQNHVTDGSQYSNDMYGDDALSASETGGRSSAPIDYKVLSYTPPAQRRKQVSTSQESVIPVNNSSGTMYTMHQHLQQ